jgi:hypothetical protein
MTMRVRTGLLLTVALAIMGLASCGHYVCGANFGISTCASGQPSLSGGNGGSTAAAFVFVLNGSGNGSMVGYTLNTSATPPTLTITANSAAIKTPSADAGVGMTLAQKQFLYAAFGSTQQILGWTISTTGGLTAMTPVSEPLLTQFSATVFDTQRVIANPAGTLLFVGDEFFPQVFVYQIGSGGVLTAVAGSPFSVSFSPGNMTTDGQGKYLYFTDSSSGGHSGSQVAAYSIGTGTGSALGALTLVPGSPFSAAMWQVKGEPTGQFLIGTTGLTSDIYVFSISPSTGALSTPVLYPTTNPSENIAVQQNSGGNLVYSFGLDSAGTGFNAVEGYQLSSGVLAKVNGSPFSIAAVGDSGQFDPSGGLLFVYGGLSNGKTVIYTLTSFDVSAGNLTTPTLTGTYGGYWVVTDVP